MKTPITYYGGKQSMLKHILPLIPEHETYTESFCGGCAVFFAKEPAKCEVINDLNKGLINFYTVVQREYPRLAKEIKSTLHSRDMHTHALHINKFPQFFTSVQWAWAIWTLSHMSFASKIGSSFGYDRDGKTRKAIINSGNNFTEHLCSRLQNATIENDNALNIISRFDSDYAFHFVDPPYVNSNCGHYSGTFTEGDLENLLILLSEVKGKFMLTMFPHNSIESAATKFGWTIHRIERNITASKTVRRKQEEWIVCNYNMTLKS